MHGRRKSHLNTKKLEIISTGLAKIWCCWVFSCSFTIQAIRAICQNNFIFYDFSIVIQCIETSRNSIRYGAYMCCRNKIHMCFFLVSLVIFSDDGCMKRNESEIQWKKLHKWTKETRRGSEEEMNVQQQQRRLFKIWFWCYSPNWAQEQQIWFCRFGFVDLVIVCLFLCKMR